LAGLALAMPATAGAKEIHFSQVRVLLVSRMAKCTSCHAAADGAALNAYGKRIAEMPASDTLADRIAAVESDPPLELKKPQAEKHKRGQDVDQDRVPNWVEIVAGTDPSDAKSTPERAAVERIEKVVSCTLCHKATGLPGEGLEANPHNAFGALLAETLKPRPGTPPPKTREAIRAAAERLPILTRLGLVASKKPRGGKATYWERILLLVSPAEAEEPEKAALAELRKRQKQQKNRKTRDANLGLGAEAHALDGFLKDAEGVP